MVFSIFAKIFEILVHFRMTFLNEAFCKVDEFNGGFVRGCRTTDYVFVLNGLVQRQIAMGKPLYICYVDFSMAFDSVNRHILFYKLINQGWSGRVIDTMIIFYSKTYFRVKINGRISPPSANHVGVNQGGNVSGLLFRKYMADLSDYWLWVGAFSGLGSCGIAILRMAILQLPAPYPIHANHSFVGWQLCIRNCFSLCFTYSITLHSDCEVQWWWHA